jgi:hypothetical protein
MKHRMTAVPRVRIAAGDSQQRSCSDGWFIGSVADGVAVSH